MARVGQFCIRSSWIRGLSTTSSGQSNHFKLAVVGGGAGGSAVSSIFSKAMGKKNVGVIEPQEDHYYQPLWTLVGAGTKTLNQSKQPMHQVLDRSTWIKDKVSQFQPNHNTLLLQSGDKITYDFLVVAVGLQCRYDMMRGLEEGLRNYPEVCTNYDHRYVQKTYEAIKNFRGGTALFTMNTPIKCPGAPQKIMYLAEDYFRRHGNRDKSRIIYVTQSPHMLGPKVYSEVLYKICKKRSIETNFETKLIEIDPKSRTAVFDVLAAADNDSKKKTIQYDFLHVGPPFSSPETLRKCAELTDSAGWLNVDKYTLQSQTFANVFGLGDCTSSPNPKTAAAVASQAGVVEKNLKLVMKGEKPAAKYDGYSSCPIPTSYNSAILAEFDYDLNPLETFPIDQSKERIVFYFIKSTIVPMIYWKGLVRGMWRGPSRLRKFLRLGFS